MSHLVGTAIIGYGYIIMDEEVDHEKYYHDLYNTDLLFQLDCDSNHESPWFYGCVLKSVDIDWYVDEESRLTQENLHVSPEVKAEVTEGFKQDFPELKDKKACVRLMPHVWW